MYANGQCGAQDYAEAVRWYRKGAEQGDATAQFNLGLMYQRGQGAPQDYVQAHMWLNLAASHASGNDQNKYGDQRDFLAEKMTAQQVAAAQRLAREWKPKAK
jgi:TPR repeat protein